MSWFKKKPDLLSVRARDLSGEIAALEAQIKQLDSRLKQNPSLRLGPGTLPRMAAAPPPAPKVHEPVFVEVDRQRLDPKPETASNAAHYNELGVRKYDLPALLRRCQNHFRAPSASNPRLINYLAAGGIQGLPPMRYEKRVARNRFLFLAAIILAILFGSIFVLLTHH